MITLRSIVSIKSAPLSSELGDSLVVMDIDSGRYFNFDNVARSIWKALDAPIVVSDLCDRLIAEYDGQPERIRASTIVFLQKLQDNDLIIVEPGPTIGQSSV